MGSPHIERDRRILELRKEGKTQREIAKAFGISHTRVSQIKRKAEWDARKGKCFEPSCRLINCMAKEGFLPRDGHLNYLRDVKPALPAFYDHVMEELPEGEWKPAPWARVVKEKAGPRWKRIPNFGPKALAELRSYLGIGAPIPDVETKKQKILRLETALRRITTAETLTECQNIAREALGE